MYKVEWSMTLIFGRGDGCGTMIESTIRSLFLSFTYVERLESLRVPDVVELVVAPVLVVIVVVLVLVNNQLV